MGGDSERQRRELAYLTDDQVPAEERGWAVLGLLAHALAAMLLTAAEATWVIAAAVRVWRRRNDGWTVAVRTGVHRPTLAALLAARLGYVMFRRIGLTRFHRRAEEHAGRDPVSADR
ncbi:MAG TPA: hypothetical protein VH089_03335 [Streptosporangiaceae bacterium]|jgi:hypothetical protein|nr:hypothetical protein [Streptosporangiaceae bacterium]